jgi:hypothetical protein
VAASKAAVILTLSASATGCAPFERCWPDVTAQVHRSPSVQVAGDPSLVVAAFVTSAEAGVTETDPQGLPVGGPAMTVFAASQSGVTSVVFRGEPAPSWYVAFLDLDGNRRLDVGEPFGIDPENPRPATCDPYTTSILIDRIRQ